jgi:hypothetical protein
MFASAGLGSDRGIEFASSQPKRRAVFSDPENGRSIGRTARQ